MSAAEIAFGAKIGDIICLSGRGTRCIYKRNASFVKGQVKGMICGLMSQQGHTTETAKAICSKAGEEVLIDQWV